MTLVQLASTLPRMPVSPAAIARSVLPLKLRTAIRRSRLANWWFRKKYGGIRSAQHPCSRYQFYFDGERHPAWASGDLKNIEHEEMDYIAKRAATHPIHCAWDVGANNGLWMLFLAGLHPPPQQIICFEPEPKNAEFLAMNVEQNGLKNVRILQLALSSTSGSATFRSDPITGCTGTLEQGETFIAKEYGQEPVPITVEMKTADDLIAAGTPAPDFLKIDVEGHELSVLEGARQTLATHRPWLIMEVTARNEQIGKLLDELGYDLYRPATGEKMRVPEFATVAIPRQ